MLCPLIIFSQSDYLIQDVDTNSQTEEAKWSESTLFAKEGHTWVQED